MTAPTSSAAAPAQGHAGRAGRLARWLRLGIFFALDSLVLLMPRQADRRTSLIVRLDALGDFALWLQSGAAEVIEAARGSDRRKVVLCANAVWAGFARDLKIVDEVVAIEVPRLMREPLYRLKSLLRIRRVGASCLFQPRSAKVFLQEDEIARTCGAEERVGAEGSLRNTTVRLNRAASRYYSRIVPVAAHEDCHESVRGRAFARALRAPGKTVFAPPIRLEHGDDPAIPEVRGGYIVVAPGAGWSGRQWPIEHMEKLVRAVHQAHGLKCVVVGSAADGALARPLAASLPDVVIDHTGQSSIIDTARIMAASRLVVANESGPLHLAIWSGSQVIGIVGGGHFGWFAPYPIDMPVRARFIYRSLPCFGCDWHCRFPRQANGAVKCIDEVSCGTVLRAALEMLLAAEAITAAP